MSDKDRKGRSSFVSSLRRSLARPGGPATTTDEIRPMLLPSSVVSTMPGQQARPSLTKTTPHRPGRAPVATENFEISLRDKSDATAKRGFRVQVPKRMLSYAVLVFVVCPIALFVYMEMHKVAATHAGHHHGKVADQHFHHDVLSLLTDEEPIAEVPDTNHTSSEVDKNAGAVAGNGTLTNSNSTQLHQTLGGNETIGLNATGIQDMEASNHTSTAEKLQSDEEQHRFLRKPLR